MILYHLQSWIYKSLSAATATANSAATNTAASTTANLLQSTRKASSLEAHLYQISIQMMSNFQNQYTNDSGSAMI